MRLGALSLAGDEETTALATLALLDGWPPELPGGLVYLRGLVFTALEAVSVAIAGPDEASLRLVPVLAAGPRVFGAWWLARPFLGGPAALGVAGLLALAPLDVELSRDARMYSLFGTFDVLFLALAVRLIRTGSGTLWTGLAGAFAVLTHALAAFHAPLPLLAALAPGIRLRRAFALAIVTVMALVAFQLERDVMARAYAGIDHVDVDTGGSRRRPLPDHLERMWSVSEAPVSASVAGVAALASAGLTLMGLMRLRRPAARAAAATTGIAWIAASPVFGAPGLLVTLMLEGLPIAALRGPARGLLAAGLVATTGWAAAVLGAGGSLEACARLLLGFPAPNWLEFGQAAPGLVLLALGGVWVAVDRAAHSAKPGAWLLLVAAALTPALVGGLVWRTEALRYHFHALVPLLVLAWLAAHTLSSLALRRRGGAPVLVLTLLLMVAAVRPDQALRAVLREHGPVSESFAVLKVAPDHRGAGAFLLAHAKPDEWIAAEDPLQQRFYAGRADVWLRRIDDAAAYLSVDPLGGAPRDVYTGSRHANDLAALREMASAHEKSVVWLVTSGEVEAEPQLYRTDETHQTLEAWRPLAWFVGADGLTRVYRLDDGEPSPPGP